MFYQAFRYRFYPTDEQVVFLAKTYGCGRFVFNYFLEEKQKYYTEHKKSLSYGECSKQLTELKFENIWLKEVSSVVLQQALRHLETAFKKFHKREAKFPKPKKRHHGQSATFMKNAFTFKGGQLTLAKCKQPLDIRWSRELPGEPVSVTVSKDNQGRYYISILVEVLIKPLPKLMKTVGIDLGLTNAITTSDGQKIRNELFLKPKLKRLKRKQQALSRKKKGSANRKKARQEVAKLSCKIQDTRKDYLHKQSMRLVSENQVISAESLSVRNMMKNKHLARDIGDASWGTLLRFLKYKSEWYGREFVQIDRYFPSSKQCYHCKGINEALTLSDRVWKCPHCHSEHDRDVTAAINIREEGLRQIKWCTVGHTGIKACGADVRPAWQSRGQLAVNQELGL